MQSPEVVNAYIEITPFDSVKYEVDKRMMDHDEADDKIIAIPENDNIWGAAQGLSDLPEIMVERLRHYFSTFKSIIGEETKTSIEVVYEHDHAIKVVEASLRDYEAEFGD